MIHVTISRTPSAVGSGTVQPPGVSLCIAEEHAPALRSALEDLRNVIGARLETGGQLFAREDALTRAAVAVGELAAGFNAMIPAGDPDYD